MAGSFSMPRHAEQLALAVLEFFVPGHLDGFELGFVGGGGIAGEAGEFGDPFVHVSEADSERISVREFVRKCDGDVFEIVPSESWRHAWLLEKIFSFQWSVFSKTEEREKVHWLICSWVYEFVRS